MGFSPVLPSDGLIGWQFLQRTYDVQLKSFSASVKLKRDVAYFNDNIAKVTSAEALVSDRKLLNVALGAFGLQDDLPNKYFIQRILSDGTTDKHALAVRLSDDRYKQLSDAFGFGPGGTAKTTNAGLMSGISEQFRVQQFEQAVGEQDNSMRISLFAKRELAQMATDGQSDKTRWFNVMGQPSLRELFETALGLPKSFGQIDIDRQLGMFRDRAQSVLGDNKIGQFSDPAALDKLITIYQARVQIDGFSSATSSAAVALMLLQ